MKQRDNLDRFLDSALADFSSATPREGLERRILANLAVRAEERRNGWRWMWVAVPATVVLVMVVLVGLSVFQKQSTSVATTVHKVAKPVSPREIPKLSPAQSKQVAIIQTRPRRRTKPELIAKAHVRSEPRLDIFPSPDNGEQQARMLLRFVTMHPEQAKEVVREEQEFQQMAEAMINRESETRPERER